MFEDAALQMIILVVVVSLFDLVMKAIALWKAARARQKYWFIALLLLNTVGVIPLIYIFFVNKRASKQ
ncbi:hypothetical protein A2801_00145 [Candidatus Woesebacteria bacterium RIFCSPHIGHO2_01_FULL_41_10]|uniref:DUF5652 domain-containing protein n=1 Tax=Candidatus Woesebacteria bacterium RIFCSPHIGHO2_01_FULL_41_10 TaxID=1802500 RepID=A0A1F7YR55_9BACT|nr:MAG: hypothetical protein A2801_00145 [Candidatus Woesebacteria bacterium RIFCSPHIGHO2_01_FULL_41_10]